MRVHLFGFSEQPPDAQPEPVASRVVEFLEGKPVALDAELARALHREFSEQERYRLTLVTRLRALVERLNMTAAELAPLLEVPYAQSQAYQAGYSAAAYKTAADDAQAVQTVLNEISAEIGS